MTKVEVEETNRVDLSSLVLERSSVRSFEQKLDGPFSDDFLSIDKQPPENYGFGWHKELDVPGKHDNILNEMHSKLYGYIMGILSIPIIISVTNYSYNHVMAEQANNLLPPPLYHWCDCPLHIFLRDYLGLTWLG